MTYDCVEVYMDDFIIYGDTFEQALNNLDRVLKRCKYYNLSLSYEKYFIMMQEGIMLGHPCFSSRHKS